MRGINDELFNDYLLKVAINTVWELPSECVSERAPSRLHVHTPDPRAHVDACFLTSKRAGGDRFSVFFRLRSAVGDKQAAPPRIFPVIINRLTSLKGDIRDKR